MPEFHEDLHNAWQQRVLQEKAELKTKADALAAFYQSGAYKSLDPIDQQLLHAQLNIMLAYINVLNLRISRF